MSKKDVYETDTHKIYNLIVGHTNKKLQEKVASDSTLQVIKSGRDLIGYLTIIKNI